MTPDLAAIDEQEAHDRAALLLRADDEGEAGRLARLALVTIGIDRWVVEELARGASFAEILATVTLRSASMVATQIVNAELTGNRRAVFCAGLANMTRRLAERVEAKNPPNSSPAAMRQDEPLRSPEQTPAAERKDTS